MRTFVRRLTAPLALAAAGTLAAHPAVAANVVLLNADPPGVGLNDPTPVDPLPDNPGTTLGEQRQNVFQFAADLWGATLESAPDITVQASFSPLPCDATSGVLAQAGPRSAIYFPNAPDPLLPNTWYVGALVNALLGISGLPAPQLMAQFNGDIGTNPDCLTGADWYYGLDGNNGPLELDFLPVVVHELAHGLGFLDLVSESTGALFGGVPDIYTRFMYDTTQGRFWPEMTDAERLASGVNTGNLVWAGSTVTSESRMVLGDRPTVAVASPYLPRESYEARSAAFGPPLSRGRGLLGRVVLVDDGEDVGSDGCEPIQNRVWNAIALIDSGGCDFDVKVKNAQDAGARGAIIANNVPKGLPPMDGDDPDIYIPSVGISQQRGDAMKDALRPAPCPGGCDSPWKRRRVQARLYLDPGYREGADPSGLVRLYAPDPSFPGSSKSHWDTTATPSLLMEPFITGDLDPTRTLDLTPALFHDLGWMLR